MSFADALKIASDNSFQNYGSDYNEVIAALSSDTCPQNSPKQLMSNLDAAMQAELGWKRTLGSIIDEIYASAKKFVGSADVDDFIRKISGDLNTQASSQGATNAVVKAAQFFDSTSKDPNVAAVISDIRDRVDHFKTHAGSIARNPDGSADIRLSCRLQQTTGDSVEDAIRNIFFDIRKARKFHGRADLVLNANTRIEIKYSRSKFSGLATDSQGLVPDPGKWYLYVSGDVPLDQSATLKAWFMRSDELFNALLSQQQGVVSISPASGTALQEIEREIDLIKNDLARAILNKAGGTTSGAQPIMSLDKHIGINRVRFDLKFESVLRSTIREILRG